MKKYKKIIICFSCILLLVTSLIVPAFAFQVVENNTTMGQQAFHKSFPLTFERGVLTCYGVVQEDFSQIDDVILFDMPSALNTQIDNDFLSTENIPYNTHVYPHSVGSVVHHTRYSAEDRFGVISSNLFGPSVRYSHRQKLELYCNSAFVSDEDFNTDDGVSPFQIIVNNMESVSRCRVSFSVAIPKFEVQEYTDDGVATDVRINYEFVDIVTDIEPESISSNGAYRYIFLTREMLIDNGAYIGGSYFYSPDGSNIPFQTYNMNYVYITNFRFQIDGTRHFSINNMEPNYDFSFAYSNYCVDNRQSFFILNDVVSDIDPNVNIIDFEDISLVNWLVTQINGILNIELIPNVFIGSILWFIIGIAIFFLLLKIFLGG